MKKFFALFFAVLFCFSLSSFAQIPTATLIKIVKAEDERRYDTTLENLLTSADAKVRARAALAAGRIGDDRAVSALVNLLEKDANAETRAMAAFALGEIESIKAADAIIKILQNLKEQPQVRARAIEAAGKISASNAKDAKSKLLNEAILNVLNIENNKRSAPNENLILLGLTAVLRARPEGRETVIKPFLGYSNDRIRADALNTLARIRAKNANDEARNLLEKDSSAVVRANAARVLGAAEDKEAFALLLKAAVTDQDSRVRVSAIRSLASLKDARAADSLMNRAEKLIKDFAAMKTSAEFPKEKSEILEIFTTLGRLLANSKNARAISLIEIFRQLDKFSSPETEIAFARIAPEKYISEFKLKNNGYADWRIVSAYAQGLGEIANSQNEQIKIRAGQTLTSYIAAMTSEVKPNYQAQMVKAMPDLIQAMSALKPGNLTEILRAMLTNPDVQIRATAAGILADQPAAIKENMDALKTAFTKALLTDKKYNDAQLAILDALYKLDKKAAVGTFLTALNSPDYLVRKKAFQVLSDQDLQKDFPGISASLQNALAQKKNQVLPYAAYTGTKLGQILNTNADYARAVSRKNAKAIVTTTKGVFTIEFFPQEAPLTVDNFIKLAKLNYFNNITIHRVVPNFVMQDGDPRGDGNGGPGWEIRDEINEIPYERGMVGMALSGKDTGGSQWFITHSPQPHLDGGYTVFGRVNETDMKIVDNLVRGDKILNVRIVESVSRNNAKKTK